MKKILALLLCFGITYTISNGSAIHATGNEESTDTVTVENNSENINEKNDVPVENSTIEDKVLTNLTAENIEVINNYTEYIEMSKSYSSAYDDYKDYGILYQQYTGITTLPYLDFSLKIDGVNTEDYEIENKIKNNPANEKNFINTAQEFEILADVIITNKNGESVTIEKPVKSKVVKVEGKVINRKAHAIADLVVHYNDNVLDSIFNNSVQYNLQVEMMDGTVKKVKALANQGIIVNKPDGTFYGEQGGVYDLKYIIEDATDPFGYNTILQGYFIDDNNNIVDRQGKVIIPFDKREIKEYKSTNTEIKLNAKVGTIPDSAVLESTQRTDLNLDKEYVAYDMNLLCNDEYIQPVGSVDLTIAIPKNLLNKDLGVYYMDDKGNLEELESVVNGDSISFTTTHFSTYVVMEKTESSKPSDDDKKPTTPTTPNTDDKKPSTPNTNGNKETPSTDKKETIKNTSDVATGDSTNTLPFVILSLSTLLVMGVVIRKKVKHVK